MVAKDSKRRVCPKWFEKWFKAEWEEWGSSSWDQYSAMRVAWKAYQKGRRKSR